MKEHLSSLWYNIQSIPYVIFAIFFACTVLFIYAGLPLLKRVKPQWTWIDFLIKRIVTVPLVFVFTIAFSYNFFRAIDYTKKAGISSEAERKELKTLLNISNTDNKILRVEIENLRNAALNVQSLSKLHEVNLLKTDMISTIAHTENFDDEPNLVRAGSHGKQFWLVSQYNLKGIKYGIDLDSVKVLQENGILHVYGVKAKYNGIEDNREIYDALYEVRSYESDNGILKNEKVLYDAVSLAKRDELKKKYHNIDLERIKNTSDQFEWINTLVEKYAHEYLKTALLGLYSQIIFEDSDSIPSQAVSLKDFYQEKFSKVSKTTSQP